MDDPFFPFIPFVPPRASLKRWLIGIAAWTAILTVLYLAFAWLRS